MKTQKLLGKTRIREIMTCDVQSVMINDSLKEAVALMLEFQLTTIPVVNSSNHCVGILSRSDLTEFFLQEDMELARALDEGQMSMARMSQSTVTCSRRLVREMMTHDVTQIQEDQNLIEACREMVRRKIHHLPVVDADGCISGMLSAFDIVTAIANTE